MADEFEETAVPVNFGDSGKGSGRKKRSGGLSQSVLWGDTAVQPVTLEEASIHYALMDADAKIDSDLGQLKGSRRFYYRGDSEEDSEEFYSTRDSFRSVMSQKQTSGEDVGSSRFHSVSSGQWGEMSEFLSSQANIDVMQRDLAEAEALFFEKYSTSTLPQITNAGDGSSPQFKIQLFNPRFYDNVEHVWEKKPFVVEGMLTFFGTIREDRMDKVVKETCLRIFEHGEDCWDKEGLVLADVGRLFGCKLLFSVNNPEKLLEADKNIKIEYLSGVWLSKVYSGEYELFSNWVEDTLAYVKRKYNKVVNAHQNWFAFYPSALEQQKSAGECVVVFFTKIAESEAQHKQASKEFQSIKLEI